MSDDFSPASSSEYDDLAELNLPEELPQEPVAPTEPPARSAQEEPPADLPSAPGGLAPSKAQVIAKALHSLQDSIATILTLLEDDRREPAGHPNPQQWMPSESTAAAMPRRFMPFRQEEGKVIEGVFDGKQMIGADGKPYVVPPNYASKSKLVEGDLMKLTITPTGSFIYKQIGPIERSRIVATLGFDETINDYYAATETQRWNVLKASVTYYRGEPGDEIILLVPKNSPSKWAAVENILKKNPLP